jgi:hypothetical protein
MIEKLFPRILSSSKDARAQEATEFVDALNIQIGEDYVIGNYANEGGVDIDTGNFGVIKPVKGNEQTLFGADESSLVSESTKRILGSVSDTRNNVVYFFVFSETVSEQGVYAVDQFGTLFSPATTTDADTGEVNHVIHNVYTTSQFQFTSNMFVKGDIVHTTKNPRGILYFTDGVNEPRKLNIGRCLDNTAPAPETTPIDVQDFITACPKMPVYPPSFAFTIDPTIVDSDFRNVQGFQFAYQCIYRDGEESAISTYSEMAIPPSYLNQGAEPTADLVAHNLCVIQVNKAVNGITAFTSEVERIRLLGRIGNDGGFFIIDEKNTDGDNNVIFEFSNKEVLTAVLPEDEQKQFDALPRRARAQAVINDRLFYGHYTEGYDDVGDVSATTTIQPLYRERPEDFQQARVEVRPIMIDLGELSTEFLTSSGVTNRTAGYEIDFENLPDFIEAGTVLSFNFFVSPTSNFHLYNAENSFHAYPQAGLDVSGALGATGAVGGSGSVSPNAFTSPNSNLNVAQNNSGVLLELADGETTGIQWNITEGPLNSGLQGTSIDAVYGLSPSNPLVIPSQALYFSVSVLFNEDVVGNDEVSQKCRDAVSYYLTLQGTEPDGVEEFGQTNRQVESPFALGLSNFGELLNSDPLTEHIVSVYDKSEVEAFEQGGTFLDAVVPCGFFILNSANVTYSLTRRTEMEGDTLKSYLSLQISDITNPDVRTAIPYRAQGSDNNYNSWRLGTSPLKWFYVSSDYLSTQDVDDDHPIVQGNKFLVDTTALSADDNTFVDPLFPQINPTSVQNDLLDVQVVGVAKRLRYFGTLSLNDEPIAKTITNTLERFGAAESNIDSQLDRERFGLSLCDGIAHANKSRPQFWFGIVYGSDFEADILDSSINNSYPAVNKTLSAASGLFSPHFSTSLDFLIATLANAGDTQGQVDLQSEQFPEISRISGSSTLTSATLNTQNTSFKTHANHEFGIIYYDERGRNYGVNRLGGTYINGYSASERGGLGNEGSIDVAIALNHAPPPWAHHYQIAYGGNSSVSDFIQYTVGGAFTAVSGTDSDGLIYVSLNYLQENADVSYARAFGAVSEDGSKDLYVFKEGDRLRIISYQSGSQLGENIYPYNYVFEVVGTTTLGNDDENPLKPEGENAHPALTGQFVLLKDKSGAAGFTYQDVRSSFPFQNTVPYTSTENAWINNCVVELLSPSKKQDAEDRVYHETGSVYNIVTNTAGELVHQQPNVLLRGGDVYFRLIAVNFADFDASNQRFDHLIDQDDAGNPVSKPSFQNFFLESNTFSDTFLGNDVYSKGKAKFINTDPVEVVRDNSIKYSDKNNNAASLVRYTSFNNAKLPFKDVPNEHGAIFSLLNYNDSLFCIQEDKCSALPVSRNLLSDAQGTDQLISSTEVLGTPIFYAGRNGTNRPESVLKVDNNVYFANPVRHEVYRFNSNQGVEVISDQGMRSYFKGLFEAALAMEGTTVNDQTFGMRVVSGYNPEQDEYIISVNNPELFGTTGDINAYVRSSNVVVIQDPDIPVDFTDGGETGGDDVITDVGGVPIADITDFVGGIEEEINTVVNDQSSLVDALNGYTDIISDVTGGAVDVTGTVITVPSGIDDVPDITIGPFVNASAYTQALDSLVFTGLARFIERRQAEITLRGGVANLVDSTRVSLLKSIAAIRELIESAQQIQSLVAAGEFTLSSEQTNDLSTLADNAGTIVPILDAVETQLEQLPPVGTNTNEDFWIGVSSSFYPVYVENQEQVEALLDPIPVPANITAIRLNLYGRPVLSDPNIITDSVTLYQGVVNQIVDSEGNSIDLSALLSSVTTQVTQLVADSTQEDTGEVDPLTASRLVAAKQLLKSMVYAVSQLKDSAGNNVFPEQNVFNTISSIGGTSEQRILPPAFSPLFNINSAAISDAQVNEALDLALNDQGELAGDYASDVLFDDLLSPPPVFNISYEGNSIPVGQFDLGGVFTFISGLQPWLDVIGGPQAQPITLEAIEDFVSDPNNTVTIEDITNVVEARLTRPENAQDAFGNPLPESQGVSASSARYFADADKDGGVLVSDVLVLLSQFGTAQLGSPALGDPPNAFTDDNYGIQTQ